MLKIGDEVNYVPHIDYHHYMMVEGEFAGLYAWEHAFREPKKYPGGIPPRQQKSGGPIEMELRTLTTQQSGVVMESVRGGREDKKNFVPTKPQVFWKGIVSAVDGDKLTVDIKTPTANMGGVTLSLALITEDPEGKVPHSCHLPK